MRTIIATTCGMALMAAGIASAQRDGTGTAAQRDAQPPAPITVTGCVTQPAGQPVGTAGGSSQATQLLLTNAAVNPAPTGTASAVPGSRPSSSNTGTLPAQPVSPSQSPSEKATVTYTLLGSRVPDLAKYSGQRVEVMGTVEVAVPVDVPRTTDTNAPGARGRTAEREGNPDGSTDRTATGGRTEPLPQKEAHPSATPLRLLVSSFKPLGGRCRS